MIDRAESILDLLDIVDWPDFYGHQNDLYRLNGHMPPTRHTIGMLNAIYKRRSERSKPVYGRRQTAEPKEFAASIRAEAIARMTALIAEARETHTFDLAAKKRQRQLRDMEGVGAW